MFLCQRTYFGVILGYFFFVCLLYCNFVVSQTGTPGMNGGHQSVKVFNCFFLQETSNAWYSYTTNGLFIVFFIIDVCSTQN